MKSIVSIQDMTEELSSEKTMTNSEDVAETETSVLVPSPKQNDAKDEGQPMDIGDTREDEVNQETPTEEMTPTNGEEREDKSNDATDENSNTDVNSNVEAAKEDQNDIEAETSGTDTATSRTETATSGDESKEAVPTDGNCANEEIKDKIDEVDASEHPEEKMEEATKESTTETASESTNTNDDTMGSGDGSDDFVNAIEEQLEKVVQEEEAGDFKNTKQPEEEPIDDRPESEKVVSFVMDALFGSAMEQVATKAGYDEALSKLNAIAQSNRRLLDEDLPGNFNLKKFQSCNAFIFVFPQAPLANDLALMLGAQSFPRSPSSSLG